MTSRLVIAVPVVGPTPDFSSADVRLEHVSLKERPHEEQLLLAYRGRSALPSWVHRHRAGGRRTTFHALVEVAISLILRSKPPLTVVRTGGAAAVRPLIPPTGRWHPSSPGATSREDKAPLVTCYSPSPLPLQYLGSTRGEP